jgi:hypothetical protein
MLKLLATLGVLWFVYALTVYWLVFWRGPFAVTYNPVIAWWLRRLGMEAITLGARVYLYRQNAILKPSGFVHEEFHFRRQWRIYPLRFAPRYLWLLARYGYAKHPMEQDARAAAGEPLR